jgi:hypothetical protein
MVKSGDNIELSIDLGLAKPFEGLTYKRYRVSILNRDGVKPSIVNTESDTSFWLLSKKDRGGYRGHARADKPFIKMLVDILLYSKKFVS